MQSERIYSAPSLVDVVKQLLIYRPTGVLTIWRAAVSRRDEVKITVEQGRPIRVFWGASYIEEVNEAVLKRFNNWGEIHFSFQTIETRLLLPSPTLHTLQPLSPTFPNHSRPQDFPQRATVTRPLPTVLPPSPQRSAFSNHGSSTPENTETVVATLTAHGRTFPAAHLPRHERTIFLLINGRRTAVDLAQLTKRALDDIYVTLYHLQSLQLVTINTLPTAQNGQ